MELLLNVKFPKNQPDLPATIVRAMGPSRYLVVLANRASRPAHFNLLGRAP